MPTVLPPLAVVPWPKLCRAIWLRILVAGLNVRMKWLPATNRQAVAAACQWIAYCEELHRLPGLPEPAHVVSCGQCSCARCRTAQPSPPQQEISDKYGRSQSQEVKRAERKPARDPKTAPTPIAYRPGDAARVLGISAPSRAARQ